MGNNKHQPLTHTHKVINLVTRHALATGTYGSGSAFYSNTSSCHTVELHDSARGTGHTQTGACSPAAGNTLDKASLTVPSSNSKKRVRKRVINLEEDNWFIDFSVIIVQFASVFPLLNLSRYETLSIPISKTKTFISPGEVSVR